MKQKNKSVKRVESLLEWLVCNNQEDRRVTIGCKTCNEKSNLLSSTALTAWLPFHDQHEVWIRNPFQGKQK